MTILREVQFQFQVSLISTFFNPVFAILFNKHISLLGITLHRYFFMINIQVFSVLEKTTYKMNNMKEQTITQDQNTISKLIGYLNV